MFNVKLTGSEKRYIVVSVIAGSFLALGNSGESVFYLLGMLVGQILVLIGFPYIFALIISAPYWIFKRARMPGFMVVAWMFWLFMILVNLVDRVPVPEAVSAERQGPDISANASSGNVTELELEALGRVFASALNTANSSQLEALVDWNALGNSAANWITNVEEEKSDFISGVILNKGLFTQQLARSIRAQRARAKYIGVREIIGLRGALIRMDSSVGGFNYILLPAIKNDRESVFVRDFLMTSSGYLLSESIGTLAQLSTRPSDSLIRRLVGDAEFDEQIMGIFREVSSAARRRDLAGAYTKLDELPPKIRNDKLIIYVALSYAGQLNEELYYRELDRLARFHKSDPVAGVHLYNHFVSQGNYDDAVEVLELMEESFGNDAALDIARAQIEMSRGNYDEAIRYSQYGIDREPGFENSYWALLNVYILSDRFSQAADVLTMLKELFNYRISIERFRQEEFFSEFAESREFSEWMSRQN